VPINAKGLRLSPKAFDLAHESSVLHSLQAGAKLRAEWFPLYMIAAGAAAACEAIPPSVTVGWGRSERNQPAESQAWGMTNSDQPQSRQTRISGEGVIGG